MDLGNYTVAEDPGHLRKLGRLFYLVNPSTSSYPDLVSLPKSLYIKQAFPYFFTLAILEWIILYMKGRQPRINDGLLNIVQGQISVLVDAFVSGFCFASYIYIHENYCLYKLPWNSVWTWTVAALGIDFGYYWVHRAHHEINVLWAAHQVHHSSENYNLTTALRQSAFQTFGSWPFYLPMAFFVPPSHAIIHKELNLLYQFWIHTEIVSTIGPLELILNTASHHRVHHGANRYCLDKNYAGVLIIWDRMFGTFQAEREDVELVYGLVDQPQYWNPAKHQVGYYWKVWEKVSSMDGVWNKVCAIIKGPGWFPGTERLGDPTFVDERPVRVMYDCAHHPSLNIYTITHFLLAFVACDVVVVAKADMDQTTCLLVISYLLWTLTNIGLLYDGGVWCWPSELLRCLLTFLLVSLTPLKTAAFPTIVIFTVSTVISGVCTGKSLLIWNKTGKED